jgi:hypothetical protein
MPTEIWQNEIIISVKNYVDFSIKLFTCFPLTKIVVMKGLIESTVLRNNEEQ